MSERRSHVSGDLLAGRYELADLVSETLGVKNWRAVDLVLHRNVRVELLAADDSRAENFLEAARRSTEVTDHRFLRVLDLLPEENGTIGVVREWAKATALSNLLGQSSLPNQRAAAIVAEVAESIAHAHQAKVVHRRLTPHQVLLKQTGAVRIVGLGVATALGPPDQETSADDLVSYQAADVTAIGRLLYACLVSRWPGGLVDGLRAAPTEHGHVLRPRKVRAGVSRELDSICDRILEPGRHPRNALTTAADIARELYVISEGPATEFDDLGGFDVVSADLLRADPVVEPSGPPPGLEPPRRRPKAFEPKPPSRGNLYLQRLRSLTRMDRALILVGLVTALLLVGVLAFFVGREFGKEGAPLRGSTSTQEVSVLPISRVIDFDPQGEDNHENPGQTAALLDSDFQTGWQTSIYLNRPDLGGLKDGVGLVLDLGVVREVKSVRLQLAGRPTDLSILVAEPSASSSPRSLSGLREVGVLNAAGTDVAVALPDGIRTRYVAIWLRSLPQITEGQYRGEIRAVTIRGH